MDYYINHLGITLKQAGTKNKYPDSFGALWLGYTPSTLQYTS
ncbi:MAG: hypothetical protein UZ08_BCD001001014 [Candidatus Parvibacillus calidus]|nr:MAG: hypothetical protein UZ08_BCD001001014 [Candidatus Parvibacillus calidus]